MAALEEAAAAFETSRTDQEASRTVQGASGTGQEASGTGQEASGTGQESENQDPEQQRARIAALESTLADTDAELSLTKAALAQAEVTLSSQLYQIARLTEETVRAEVLEAKLVIFQASIPSQSSSNSLRTWILRPAPGFESALVLRPDLVLRPAHHKKELCKVWHGCFTGCSLGVLAVVFVV